MAATAAATTTRVPHGIKEEVTKLHGADLIQLTEVPTNGDRHFWTGKFSVLVTDTNIAVTDKSADSGFARLLREINAKGVNPNDVTEIALPMCACEITRGITSAATNFKFPNAQIRFLQPVAKQQLERKSFPSRDLLDLTNHDGHPDGYTLNSKA